MPIKTVLLLDVDSTLTPPRQPLNKTMAEILQRCIPFYVVAGSHFSLLEAQFFKPLYNYGFRKKFGAFVSNGAIYYQCEFSKEMSIKLVSEFNIRTYLGDDNYNFLIDVLEKTLELQDFQIVSPLKIIGERITDRVSMINFCPIGRVGQEDDEVQLNRKRFVEFDHTNAYRKKVMSHLEQKLTSLITKHKLIITLGGQTSFDIGIADQDKTNAVRTLLQEGVDRLVFIGDALFEGGNDASIRKFVENWPEDSQCPVEAIQTNSWEQTIELLNNLGFIND